TAKPVGMGLKDLVLTPSHAMLTIHEIVAHATELDRVLGYEANYAGTSFVKLSDVGKLKYGSKLMNITADRTMPGGLATIGFDDDGVKTTESWSACRRTAKRPPSSATRPARAARRRRRGATTRSSACRTCGSRRGRRDRPPRSRSSPTRRTAC